MGGRDPGVCRRRRLLRRLWILALRRHPHRMTRRPLNFVTALSLLACVAVVVLWVRSYGHYVQFEWGESHATGFGWRLYDHSVAASDGAVYYVRSYPPL